MRIVDDFMSDFSVDTGSELDETYSNYSIDIDEKFINGVPVNIEENILA